MNDFCEKLPPGKNVLGNVKMSLSAPILVRHFSVVYMNAISKSITFLFRGCAEVPLLSGGLD